MTVRADRRGRRPVRFARALAAFALLAAAGCLLPTDPEPCTTADLFFNMAGPVTPIVAADEPVFTSRPVFTSIPGRAGSHAPTLVAFADGELLAAWYSYTGPHELNGAALYTARYSAESADWQPPQRLTNDAAPAAAGNPVLFTEGDDTWLFHAVVPGTGWSTSHVEWQRSADRGVTWTPPQVLPGPLGTNVRCPPVRTADGTLLLPAYDDLWPRALFFASTDGQQWEWRSVLAATPPHAAIQPALVSLTSGRLLAALRNTAGGWLWVGASDDDGRTWSCPQSADLPNPGSPVALLRLASGHMLLVGNESANDRHTLAGRLSADDGATWLPPRTIATGAGDYAYPAAAQTPDGLIHVVYSHDRTHIQHVTMNEAWLAE